MQVWVSESGGLEKVDEAVRRGRMIKCKACNRKGATLGCHIRSCRHSFHMVCARATKCRLHVRAPFLSASPLTGLLPVSSWSCE